jgi:FolB domain-containing protein
MLDVVSLTGLTVHAFHGVLDHEKREGQEFLVDVELHQDISQAAASDDLAAATNYADIADVVVSVMTTNRFDLIETAAVAVASGVLDTFRPVAVRVTVHKPSAPILHEFDDVSVSVWRSQP